MSGTIIQGNLPVLTNSGRTYMADVVVRARKSDDGSCYIGVRELVDGETVDYDELNPNIRPRLRASGAEGRAYLGALAWQGECTNGVNIMYYTVR